MWRPQAHPLLVALVVVTGTGRTYSHGIGTGAPVDVHSVVRRGTIALRGTSPGPPNLLPTFQVLADYPQAETMGFPHFGSKATNVDYHYNASALCDDLKRPHDVCSPPPLDTNPSVITPSGNGVHVSRYLPHLMMNQYRSERVPENMPTIVLEDAELRVDVTPQYGGKVYAMTHVPTETSLLHSPVTRQPVQTSRLGAQVDGGIEWNWSPGELGHWVGTQRDVFAAKLNTSKGPMVRIYEWDRWNSTYFQVDMIVVNGTLFAHPKVWNPNPENISGYWWTCSGMPYTTPSGTNCKSSPGNPGTRLLNPASYDVTDTLEAKPWPVMGGEGTHPDNATADMSFLSSWITGQDNFLRVLRPRRPHLTVIDRDLFGSVVGLYHGHRLNGSKAWIGGYGENSQRWYDGKDAPPSPSGSDTPAHNGGGCGDCGCFFEPQVGYGPTQARGFEFPSQSTVEWTHAWRPMASLHHNGTALTKLYSRQYNEALDVVEDWSQSDAGVSDATFDTMESFFRTEASQITVHPSDLLHEGQPHGALHEDMIGQRLTPTMLFTVRPEATAEAQPWLDVLHNGTFSSSTLTTGEIPLSYQTSSAWEDALEKSAAVHGDTYLHALHLGVIAAERLDLPRAIQLHQRSIDLHPTAMAHRNLAALGTDPAEQWMHFKTAWQLALRPPPAGADLEVALRLQVQLAGEMSLFATTVSALVDAKLSNATVLWPELRDFLATLPNVPGCAHRGKHCDHDMVAFSAMFAAFAQKDAAGCATVLDVLGTWPLTTDNGVSYVFSRSPYLQPQFAPRPGDNNSSMWATCVLIEAEDKAGHPLTPEEKAAALAEHPPPYWLSAPLS
eukprot:m.202172 g.202172  ORF g.202172 m.202172 type:complete len:838 (-) comp21693_c0_seq1:299-2812(-)